MLDDFLRQVRRDKDNARIGAQHHITGQTGCRADAARHIHANQRHVGDACGVDPLAESEEVGDFQDLLGVANATVDHLPAAGARGDGRREVAARVGAFVDLAEEVNDDGVILHQSLDHPRVHGADPALLLMAELHQGIVQVWTVGNENSGDRPAYQRAFRVQVGPVALKLKLVVFVPANAPRLFGGHVLHTAQDVVGDRAAGHQ